MLVVSDALDALFLGCFLFGLLFAGLSLLLGAGHVGIHLGHDLGHGGHGPGHVGHHGGHPSGAHGQTDGVEHDVIGPLNLSSLLAFIAWFGGVGHLARNALDLAAPLSIVVGLGAGLVVASGVWLLLSRVVQPHDRALDPEDFRLPGTIARVCSSIRAGGTGEIVYEQAGVRQVSAARAADGTALPRGREVVILRQEHGIALVEPWARFVGEHDDELAPWTDEPPSPTPSDRAPAA